MSRQPLPADTILGSGLDQYRIESVLGPGGFGITYLARSLRLDRDVAIKEYFPTEFAVRDGATTVRPLYGGGRDLFTEGLRYFIEEARVLGRFRHEHIVRLIGLLEQYGTAYMILEFEEGTSLKRWWQQLGRAPNQAEMDALLTPILSALSTIHGQRLFHRDIAPDNIIIRRSGAPVLIDFGAARQFARENSHTLGAIVKHGYSPPEQYTLDTKLQGAWSDVYSLSATLFQLMVGRPPDEASRRQLHDTVLPIEDHLDAFVRVQYRPGFLAGVNAGLALRPRDRPQTIEEWEPLLLGTVRAPRRDHFDDGERRGSQIGEQPTLLQPPPVRSIQVAPVVAQPIGANIPLGGAVPAPVEPPDASRFAGALQSLTFVAGAGGAAAFFWLGGVAHTGAWIGLAAFIGALWLFVTIAMMSHAARSRALANGFTTGTLPNMAALGAVALAGFWMPPFVLPTYWISAALLLVAGVFAAAPDSRIPGFGLGMISLGHLLVAMWLLVLQPFGTSGFMLVLGAGLLVLSLLCLRAAGMASSAAAQSRANL